MSSNLSIKQPTEDKKSKDGLSNDIAEIITNKTGKSTMSIYGFNINLTCVICKKGMLRTKHNVCTKCQVYKHCIVCETYDKNLHKYPMFCNKHWNYLTSEHKIHVKTQVKSMKIRSIVKDIASIGLGVIMYKKLKKFLPF